MSNTIDQILEKIFATCLTRKDLLTIENRDLMLAILKSAIGNKLEELNSSKNLTRVIPTEASIEKIYFPQADLTKFSKSDIQQSVINIQSILTIWEKNRADYHTL